jgi:hypothetical protein
VLFRAAAILAQPAKKRKPDFSEKWEGNGPEIGLAGETELG